jgi:hypothetical protein
VANGYAQQQGVDFDEVFAHVARIETVRVLLALAAQGGWQVHHMDVKSAFLNGGVFGLLPENATLNLWPRRNCSAEIRCHTCGTFWQRK